MVTVFAPVARAERDTAARAALARLSELEEHYRVRARQGPALPWRERSGADPFAIAESPGAPFRIGLLRGDSAVVVLDLDGREHSRHATPLHPTGLHVDGSGDVLVVSEAVPELACFRWTRRTLQPRAKLKVDGVLGLRDVTRIGQRVYATDPHRGRIVELLGEIRPGAGLRARDLALCRGALTIDAIPEKAALPSRLVANCFLDHTILVLDPDGREVARIVHDGPFWSVAATVDADGSLLVASGGVENRPLDRRDGLFGYIDSFVFVDRIRGAAVEPLAAINVSALGVVTPKWLDLDRDTRGRVAIQVAGYGSDRLLHLELADDLRRLTRVRARALPPGTTDLAGRIAANPLIDAWIVLEEHAVRIRELPTRSARSLQSRVGEILFFTTLLSPWASSEGKKSRFTCETCHHEGGIDGRTHWTGRDEIHATTKPLFGLLANRPLFSRALDPTLVRMVDNEFRVANRGSGRDAWFALQTTDHPWLAVLEGLPDKLSPEWLRGALLSFLAEHEPPPNPALRGRVRFTPLERAGAAVFRERCEGCHAARLMADDASSRIAFPEWEERIFDGGEILWGRAGYERTGVEPYVHAAGARVPSLRRLYAKWPYFTNGSARSVEEVLERATWVAGEFAHVRGESVSGKQRLDDSERRALLAFLALL